MEIFEADKDGKIFLSAATPDIVSAAHGSQEASSGRRLDAARELPSRLSKKTTIYIPAYNCADTIIQVLNKIPNEIKETSNLLIIDNCSSDGTSELLVKYRDNGLIPAHVILVKTAENLGYAGSQKLAYSIARDSKAAAWTLMLHGDGQYDPALIPSFIDAQCSNPDLVYGFRSKIKYGLQEETPITTWSVIRLLSVLESAITGYFRHEWHSGYVMYKNEFLNRVNLDAITNTPHFDGHMLFSAGRMKAKVVGVPIYKRYKELTAFEGQARRKYVFDVICLMFSFRRTKTESLIRKSSPDWYSKVGEVL